MISTHVYIGLSVVMLNISFEISTKRVGLQLYQTKSGDSRQNINNDENWIILWFLFDLSTFCPNVFLIVKL